MQEIGAWVTAEGSLPAVLETEGDDAFAQELPGWLGSAPGVKVLSMAETQSFLVEGVVLASHAIPGSASQGWPCAMLPYMRRELKIIQRCPPVSVGLKEGR